MTRLRSAVQAVLRSWGFVSAPAPHDDLQRKIDVLLSLPDGRRLVVGTLSYVNDEYVFQYSDSFKAQSAIPPITAFPNPHEEYRSPELWPFFEVRLPPVDRADVQRFIAEHRIDPNDHVRMLAELGRRSLTSPYDLELRAAAVA
jgi:HipA-like protein